MNLDERMKHYESTVGSQLVLRCPAIVRIDGRAFHTLTRKMYKPYDPRLQSLLSASAQYLCEVISTARFAYGQSDEISVLLMDYNRFETQQYFDGRVQKMCSVIASEMTNAFLHNLSLEPTSLKELSSATFDCRVFSVPERDVVNYFLWRQQDAIRNSIQGLGQSWFSPSELHGKSTEQIQAMLRDTHNVDWSKQHPLFKYGYAVVRLDGKWQVEAAPEFSTHRSTIEDLLVPEEE